MDTSLDDKYLSKCQDAGKYTKKHYMEWILERKAAKRLGLFKYLFHPDAKFEIPSGKPLAYPELTFLTPEAYIFQSWKMVGWHGFFEKESHRTVDTFW